MPTPGLSGIVIGELARELRAEALEADERRLVVLAGRPSASRQAAREVLGAADVPPADTTVVGPVTDLPGEHLPTERAGELLGRTVTAVVLDCHGTVRPNAIGRAIGAVAGGGLAVLCTPPLDEWPAIRDDGEDWLAVPPFDVTAVTGNFRARTVALLRAHPGIAIIDVDDGRIERDGRTDPAPRIESQPPLVPASHVFPERTYAACLTVDQAAVVHSFEALAEPGNALVVEADRGRGKSAGAGLAAAGLATLGADVLVTAPRYRRAGELFDRARTLLTELDVLTVVDRKSNPRRLATPEGCVRFADPAAATELPGDPDVVVVDEAAGLPVRRLAAYLAAPSVAFTTTVHGYEGAGRGFSVRFRDRLDESHHSVAERTMTTPIRYAAGDPIETWTFRTLMLDARPAVDPLVAEASPETATYERLSAEALVADEHLLRETFGLLVLAHYRTEPDDLARVLDAPNVSVRALTHDGHVVSVALLAREGNLPQATREEMYDGGRVRGNMIPDVLTTQLRDEQAGVPVGQRVLRIATHAAVRSRGLGSRLLAEVRREFCEVGNATGGEGHQTGDPSDGPSDGPSDRPSDIPSDRPSGAPSDGQSSVDWLGTGFGATPELVDFWATNDYHAVHLSTTRNDASGEHSAVMLAPCSERGRALADRHADWFVDRLPGVLTDALADVDPDVVRAVLRSVDETPALSLSEWEWRLVAGVPRGAATIDTAPGPFRRLCLRELAGSDELAGLEPRTERLLVGKVLQAREWTAVADELDYVSDGACKRAAGTAIRRLVETHGTTFARSQLGDTDG